ncbi:hypothetical protein H6G65_03385 [Microcystis elabens FACHB-917]|nr:hypothetical protein [Microcystis elabens FACHB-917]
MTIGPGNAEMFRYEFININPVTTSAGASATSSTSPPDRMMRSTCCSAAMTFGARRL